MKIQEVPAKFQQKRSDIILRINCYQRVKGKYIVVPVDLYTYQKSIEILMEAIVEAFLKNEKVKEIYNSINESTQIELKKEFKKLLLSEVYISKVHKGCWEIFMYFGAGLIGLTLFFKTALNNVLTKILEPWAKEQGEKLSKLKKEPQLNTVQLFKSIESILDKNPGIDEININVKFKQNSEVPNNPVLEVRAFRDRSNRILSQDEINPYDNLILESLEELENRKE